LIFSIEVNGVKYVIFHVYGSHFYSLWRPVAGFGLCLGLGLGGASSAAWARCIDPATPRLWPLMALRGEANGIAITEMRLVRKTIF
jgi:hypothetical protein